MLAARIMYSKLRADRRQLYAGLAVSIHEPVLVNTVGHCAGVVIAGEERGSLPMVAAAQGSVCV